MTASFHPVGSSAVGVFRHLFVVRPGKHGNRRTARNGASYAVCLTMNLRMRLVLLAMGAVCAAFVASEWMSYPRVTGGGLPSEQTYNWMRFFALVGVWSGLVVLFAGAIDRAVTLPLQRTLHFALRLGRESDPPKPQFRDPEWSELVEAVAFASRAKSEAGPSRDSDLVAIRNVRLAKEYVEGITVLLDVSRQHNTPLPIAATKNLAYMASLLSEAESALCCAPALQTTQSGRRSRRASVRQA
jgi:hypothetical protein